MRLKCCVEGTTVSSSKNMKIIQLQLCEFITVHGYICMHFVINCFVKVSHWWLVCNYDEFPFIL